MRSRTCIGMRRGGRLAALLAFLWSTPAAAQWSTVHEQFYLPASHNWVFRNSYPAADRLFNAFDYGHAILYEELYLHPQGPAERLEEKEYRFITERLLVRPPRVPLEEGAIEVAYAKIAPEAKAMFEWAHVLHRQIYDILADERLPGPEKDAAVAEVLRYYRSRPELAFSSQPKSMELMEGQYYGGAFRARYPKFNGLIWAYHWLQMGLYEPLLQGRNLEERHEGVTATVGRFWQMLANPPETLPRVMPMSPAIAPRFTERFPEAAVIFDNLHAMHDVISDILASPEVPRAKKRAEILRAAARYRDDESFTTTVAEWRRMSLMMGSRNMGGVAGDLLQPLPEPTLPMGASHAEAMRHGGADHGPAAADHPGAAHGDPGADSTAAHAGMQHGNARQDTSAAHAGHAAEEGASGMSMNMEMHRAMEFLLRLLSNPAVEARLHADPRLHELWSDPQLQRHLEMMRRMHGGGEAGHDAPAAPQQPPHQH